LQRGSPSEEQVTVVGVPVRVQMAGEGPPLVYLHGANGAVWPPGLDGLSGRFRVYLPEHPGFGESERPEWVETTQDLALFYLDLFEAMGLSGVNLVGQSLGGWIAAELASLCGHDLRRLVLVDAAGLRLPDEQRIDMFAMPPDQLVRTIYHDQVLAERVLAVAPTPDVIRAQVRNRNMTARLGWNPYLSDPALLPRLRRINVPTLVVWGAQDRLIPPSHARAYVEAIPGARLALIEDCGHVPATERPEEFARVVGDFLSDQEAEV
jgi:pimeloyl-ACP methyl ester carboxylesterase